MKLVFVHGMRQEGKDPVALKNAWEQALRAAWKEQGLAPPNYQLEMPFYGDKLDELVRALHAGGGVIARGSEMPVLSSTEELTLREYQTALGVSDDAIRTELGSEIVARGPANWEWVQALARVLENVPGFGEIGLDFVVQVNGYLDRMHIRKAVDDIVRPAFEQGPTVVVSHSLGTIVSYLLLTKLGAAAKIPLLVTLGSPLGIQVVKTRLKPPAIGIPEGVGAWINGTDPRDYVALHAELNASTFCTGITNIPDVSNPREDAHSIIGYLSNAKVARAIHEALTAKP